jgi:hypothetical protein
MHLKSIAAALGVAAALTAFATAPARANVDTSNAALETAAGSAARSDATPSSYRCGCGRRYVRYYRYHTYRYYYRVRYVRYYYI